MTTRIQLRRGSASQWSTVNPTLSSGEVGYETDTNKFKIGNGSTAWSSLDYFGGEVDLSEYLTLSSASSTYLTQASASTTYATKSYADNSASVAAAAVVDAAPETLNTLNELAAALGDDANFATTVTNSIATKAPLYPSTNAQTGTSYTLILSDAGKYIEMNNSSANTLTVPPNSSVAFPIGTEITVIQSGTGATTVSPGSGVTVDYYSSSGSASRTIKARWAAASLIKRTSDTWVLIGNLA